MSISIDGKPVTLNFVGFEREDIVIYSYLEVPGLSTVKTISITNTLMHDMFDDQSEIIHVIVNGEKKKYKAGLSGKMG